MKRLKELRQEKNLRQEDLGKLFNATKSAVSMWENGKREPDRETFLALADFFGVTVDYLMGREDTQQQYVSIDSEDNDAKFPKFQSALQSLRKESGLSQDQIAEMLAVPTRTYGSWERGERQPDFQILCKIADYFNVSTDYLLGRVPLDVVVNENPPTAEPQEGMVRIVIPSDVEPEPDDLERRIHEIVMKELEKRGL